jgi:IclR family pca regulon transcriptional regulator
VLLAALDPASLAEVLGVPSRSGLRGHVVRPREDLEQELARVRARGWALADEELAPGVRSVAVPVRDGTGEVRAAMNVTVHAAETSTQRLLEELLPLLQRTAAEVSDDWALWQRRPHVEVEPGQT